MYLFSKKKLALKCLKISILLVKHNFGLFKKQQLKFSSKKYTKKVI